MSLLRWCASSPLDFSVCHEPKRCKQHYTKMLCRVNDKFGLCRDPAGDRKLAAGTTGNSSALRGTLLSAPTRITASTEI
jgi:hypothetical protein